MSETPVDIRVLKEEIARLQAQLASEPSKKELIPKPSQRDNGSYISKVSITKTFVVDQKIVKNLKRDFRNLLNAHKVPRDTTIKNLGQNLERNWCETVGICQYILSKCMYYLLLNSWNLNITSILVTISGYIVKPSSK